MDVDGQSTDGAPLPAAFLADPYEFYRRWREDDPVHWYAPWGAWLLTRYDDVVASHRDPRLSNAGRIPVYLSHLPPEVRDGLGTLKANLAATMAFMDPPDHTRLRGLVRQAFTPRVVESVRPRVAAIVDELLSPLRGADRMDVIRDFAYPLPALVVAEILGVPRDDHRQFMAWGAAGFAFLGSGRATRERAEQAQAGYLSLMGYLRRLIDERRRDPRDDLLTAMIQAEEQGDVLSEEELVAMCISLLSAGHETTANLIGNGLLALLRNPDQLERLRRDPALIGGAVEELLRYDAPVQRNWRLATAELEIRGKPIRRGELVYQLLGAANRDPEQFPEPDRLDLGRTECRHLSFGYGIHFCVGAPLARLEAPIALNALIERLPGLRLIGAELEWRPNMAFRGLTSLPVAY